MIRKGIWLNLKLTINALNQHCLKKDQHLESIERAIRNALTKADATDSEIRQRIYASAWQAHERALSQNTQLNETARNQRREQLTNSIRQIEHEYATQQTSSSQHPVNSAPESNQSDLSGSLDRVAPSRKIVQHDDGMADFGQTPERIQKSKSTPSKRRSKFKRLAVPLISLAAFGIIGISIYNSLSDLSFSPTGNNHSSLNTGPFKEGENPDDAKWITIFTPKDATRISLSGTATAEITRVEGVDYLRIKSPTVQDTIRFDVGEGILNQLVNTTATFDIVARSSEGKPVQMSVTCDFGEMGDCQRRRYDVTGSQSDFLFDVKFDTHKKTQKSGIISVTSDLNGTGRAVDIFAIRVGKPE